MGNRLPATLWGEALKVKRSKVFIVSIFFFAFIGLMMGLMMYLVIHPEIASRSATFSMKTSFITASDWNGYFDLLLQVILTVGVIGFGVITGWGFGREFSDKTIKDIIVLPVSRPVIIFSKLIVLMVWSLLLALSAVAVAILAGFLIQLEGWEISAFLNFMKAYFLCAVLNVLLITPVALVASVGRGYILPFAFVILIMIITQFVFVGAPSLTVYFPWAVPALVAKIAGAAMPEAATISYIIYVLTVVGGLYATSWWWKNADQHV